MVVDSYPMMDDGWWTRIWGLVVVDSYLEIDSGGGLVSGDVCGELVSDDG